MNIIIILDKAAGSNYKSVNNVIIVIELVLILFCFYFQVSSATFDSTGSCFRRAPDQP